MREYLFGNQYFFQKSRGYCNQIKNKRTKFLKIENLAGCCNELTFKFLHAKEWLRNMYLHGRIYIYTKN